MRCSAFERDVPEWIKGRLADRRSEEMASHCDSCASCSRLAQEERQLLAAWSSLADPRPVRELWAEVAARLGERRAPRRWALGLRGWSAAGALAAGAACAVLWVAANTHSPSVSHLAVTAPAGGTVEAARMIEKFAELRQLPDPDSEPTLVGANMRQNIILGRGNSE